MAKLFISEAGRESLFELFDDSPEVTLGRGAASVVQISDGHASKTHFAVRRLRGRWKLVDLESKNGTRVNGTFKNTHWLAHGDSVTVGAVVVRFDAPGEPGGPPPPRAAVPVAVAAVAPVAAPAVRPVAVKPVAAVAAPAPAVAAPVTVRRRRDDDDYDDGEDGGRRPYKKQGLSGGVIAVLCVLGAGLVALILNLAMSGTNENTLIRERAQALREQGKLQEALDVLATGVADTPGWGAIQGEIAEIKSSLALLALDARERDAHVYFDHQITKRVAIRVGSKTLAPKGHVSEREAAQLLRQFFTDYGDTGLARTVLNSTASSNATYFAYQQILRENLDPARTEQIAWSETERAIEQSLNAGILGRAYERLTFALQLERVNLAADQYAAFERRVQARQEELKAAAVKQVEDTVTEGRTWASRGEASVGRAKVNAILRLLAWPDGDLKRRADDAMRAW
jgi:hypothetical protein